MTQPGSGVEHGDSGNQEHEEHEKHGHSTAAWTGVGIILVGSAIMALAVVFAWVGWFVVGAVVVVVGAIAGKVLAMAGYGDKASTSQAAHRNGGRGADLPGRSQDDSGTQ
ncbi:MAG TPA: HGxxPAAW family protein [Lapillicoccus sp.]